MVENRSEQQYLNLLQSILNDGAEREDRTGIGTKSLFSPPLLRFNLEEGYPLLTTKKMAWKNMVRELLWFVSGSSNVHDLPKQTQKWWAPWANENGDLGPVYGKLWRSWPYKEAKSWEFVDKNVDQLQKLIEGIKNNPNSRRHIISTWHPGEIENQALPPCHGVVIQFYVDNGKLSCFTHQRSADCFIGLPHNLSSYSLFLMMISQVCNLRPSILNYSLGDAHIYLNHLEQAKEQLLRKPYQMPKILINPNIKDVDDFKLEDFKLEDYKCHSKITAPIAV